MRVEATFQNNKNRGWDLEASLIQDFERLDWLRLSLFVAMCRKSSFPLTKNGIPLSQAYLLFFTHLLTLSLTCSD